jgi:DNA-binding transcriptional ArsR family regulator
MNGGKKTINGNIEVTSQELRNELIEIKDRVGALENVAGIAHQDILVKYFAEVLNSNQRRQIMAACSEPQTRKTLVEKFKFNSIPALDYHLKPLREGLIHEIHVDGEILFEWSLLFKRLPKKKRDAILAETQQKKK